MPDLPLLREDFPLRNMGATPSSLAETKSKIRDVKKGIIIQPNLNYSLLIYNLLDRGGRPATEIV